jgi:hypothetical protein
MFANTSLECTRDELSGKFILQRAWPIHSCQDAPIKANPGGALDNYQRGSQKRLQSYIWLGRIAFALAIGGLIAIALGTLCLPMGLANPKALGSSFVVFAAAGSYFDVAPLMFEIGGLLVLSSAVLKLAIRLTFRERRG